MRLAALGLAAMLPAACVAPEGSTDPFAGAWTNGESHRIAFRDNTVVQQPANGPPTPMSSKCGCRSTSGITIFPTNPVPQTTTFFFSAMGSSSHPARLFLSGTLVPSQR